MCRHLGLALLVVYDQTVAACYWRLRGEMMELHYDRLWN